MLPTDVTYITKGNVSGLKVFKTSKSLAGSIVAIDRGYIDYRLFNDWAARGPKLVLFFCVSCRV